MTTAPEQAPRGLDPEADDDLERTVTTRGSGWDPKDLDGERPHHRWAAEDYRPAGVYGDGARKLASSAVAPLVAMARGYQTLHEGNFKEIVTAAGIRSNAKQYTMLHEASVTPPASTGEQRDALVMPWFTAKTVNDSSLDLGDRASSMVQFRPSHPYTDTGGRVVKYVFAKGARMVTDIHPSTPREWLSDNTIPVLMAEGLLKGDSALSGWLLHAGFRPEDLAVPVGVRDTTGAREALAALLAEVPDSERLLITRTASATTFEKDPEAWITLDYSGRECWIGMDADISGNPMVWRAAKKLAVNLREKQRASAVKVLSPQVTDAEGDDAKAGIDDFLYDHSWAELVDEHKADEFPAPPEDDTAGFQVGDWRMTKDGASTEKLFQPKEDDGTGRMVPGEARWVSTGMHIGGRQVAREVYRTPIDSEIANGKIDHGQDQASETQVSIEIAWRMGDDIEHGVITGPLDLLSEPPEKWRGMGAEIPADIQELRLWPPRGADGVEWLKAMKSARRHDVEQAVCWTRMGWVPVEGHLPGFLVGRNVITENESAHNRVKVGFDADVLPHFEQFGIGGWGADLPDADFKDPIFLRQVLADLEDLMDLYIHSGAWTDQANAAAVLLTALRPVFPTRPKSTLYVMGEKGRGKSMTAKYMMLFWAHDRTAWAETLPGSANDTESSIENAIGHAPIWVLDDLAPSTNGRQAQLQEAKIENVIRAQFNAAGKGRMKADMTTRQSTAPMAQLIITAENEISTPSARERMIPIEIGKGALSEDRELTDAIKMRAMEDGLQARVTSHLVRFLLFRAQQESDDSDGSVGGWKLMRDKLVAQQETMKRKIIERMDKDGLSKADTERSATLAADMAAASLIVHSMVGHVVRTLGVDPRELRGELADWFGDRIGGSQDLIRRLVQVSHRRGKALSPGRSLIKAVQNLLATHAAHIDSGEDPDLPPYMASKAQFGMDLPEKRVNTLLGWTAAPDGTTRPNGPTIGTLVAVNDRYTVLLNKETAFREAQRLYPTLVFPGQKSRQAWTGLDSEGFWPDYLPRGSRSHYYRHRTTNASGFPIALETLLGYDPEDEGDD